MVPNNFTELYKKLSNAELLEIVADAADYHPLAVETARLEIDKRQLSPDELTAAQDILDLRKQAKEKQ
jgi:hypothetical protein